ncbi:MAG: hypothetical protein HPY46_08445 [Candidatus Aminicenantes bacterium]|nr:hypothetical protein [Candidatus Aminicenantes bacterium]
MKKRRILKTCSVIIHFSISISFALIFFLNPALARQQVEQAQTQATQVVDYRIGAKDLLEIKVYELPELNQTVRVAEDGTITLAVIGPVPASGLTAQELEKRIAAILDEKYTKGAHVTVIIREHQKIAVLGAVAKPGLYEMAGPTTLLQILSEAGGLTQQAGKEIHILRQQDDGNSKERIVLNVDDLMRRSQDTNIILKPKDEIIVPFDQTLTVFVYGEVRNPGAIQFLESKGLTLLKAVAQAGGLTEWANAVQVLVKRKDPQTGKEKNLWFNLKKIIDGKRADFPLQDGDIIIVK